VFDVKDIPSDPVHHPNTLFFKMFLIIKAYGTTVGVEMFTVWVARMRLCGGSFFSQKHAINGQHQSCVFDLFS